MAALAVLALPLLDCRKGPEGGKPLRRARQRVFVMGFDGMDPTLARKWMDEGKLPNLKALADEGVFARLGSTQPSESPTAWSSFATGVNPGKHSIYDFLIRDLETYLPDLNMVRKPKEPPKFLFGLIPTEKPKLVSMRGGTSFWKTASADGVRSVVLTVPVTFPPEELHHGEMLGGLPAAGRARVDGHLLLLGDRPQRLRGGQHRVRRLPEAGCSSTPASPRRCSRAPRAPSSGTRRRPSRRRRRRAASPRRRRRASPSSRPARTSTCR